MRGHRVPYDAGEKEKITKSFILEDWMIVFPIGIICIVFLIIYLKTKIVCIVLCGECVRRGVISVALFLTGLSLFIYPMIANYINNYVYKTEVIRYEKWLMI